MTNDARSSAPDGGDGAPYRPVEERPCECGHVESAHRDVLLMAGSVEQWRGPWCLNCGTSIGPALEPMRQAHPYRPSPPACARCGHAIRDDGSGHWSEISCALDNCHGFVDVLPDGEEPLTPRPSPPAQVPDAVEGARARLFRKGLYGSDIDTFEAAIRADERAAAEAAGGIADWFYWRGRAARAEMSLESLRAALAIAHPDRHPVLDSTTMLTSCPVCRILFAEAAVMADGVEAESP